MIEITVRPMTPEDIPIIAAWLVTLPLMQRYGLTLERAQAQFEKALDVGDILVTADLQDHPACGFAWAIIDGAFGRSVYLRLIGVQPGHEGVGIGAALLAEVEASAVVVSDALFLLVSDFNKGAQRFYQRYRYLHVGSISGYVLPDVTELIYWKRLR